MLKINLMKGTQLDKEATRKKMEERGFEISYENYPESVTIKLTDEGNKRYMTDDEAIAALCGAFVGVKAES